MAEHGGPLSHVLDHNTLDLPWWSPPSFELTIVLPKVFGVQVTRFMVMEVIAAVLVIAVMIPVARHMIRSHITRGSFMNMFEAMLLFIRDDVARPAIGGHGADRFLPYLWTVFFFVLFMNITGIVPFMNIAGSSVIGVPLVLAAISYITFIYAGVKKGTGHFFKNSLFPAGVPWPLYFIVTPIEFISTFIVRPVTLTL